MAVLNGLARGAQLRQHGAALPADTAGFGDVIACLQTRGKILALPESWWHATCNVEPFTIGLGGQDGTNRADGRPRLDPALGDDASARRALAEEMGKAVAEGKAVDRLYPAIRAS